MIKGVVLVLSITAASYGEMSWDELPPLPDRHGVGGPCIGIHNDVLIVAGGANFPVEVGQDLWQVPKQWHDEAYVLSGLAGPGDLKWHEGFQLEHPVAYCGLVSTPHGVVCMGGNDEKTTFDLVFLLQWDGRNLKQTALPDLPRPCAFGSATLIGDTVYLAGGQSGAGLDSAMNNFWSLDLSLMDSGSGDFGWQKLPDWPGPARAFNVTLAQHNGYEPCVYVISGRRQLPGVEGADGIEPLTDVYEYTPSKQSWRRRKDIPAPVMAGTGAPVGQSHLFVLSGDDGVNSRVFWERAAVASADELETLHPGFPKKAWAYHTITDTWVMAGETPANQVTAIAVKRQNDIFLVSGEIRPRVRTPQAWRIRIFPHKGRGFGVTDFSVIGIYLLAMLGVGAWFTKGNRSTNDYFRGGQRIPWWVAGCSIFATMLSSIAYIAIPAKAYAQDWILMLASLMIPVVAPLAVYLALPFFRRIDATSAYEYLEKRFNRPVRLLGSGIFTLFHIFRMGIVLSLAGLALATFTPLSPVLAVIIMGVLCVVYSTLGGIKAVVWADTIQTFILIAGVFVCFGIILQKTDGGVSQAVQVALADGKLKFASCDFSRSSITTLAVWVVVIGGLGQNMGSYLGDQSVIQRYVSTPTRELAARSIWTNAVMAVPATLIFFSMGTLLYVFYKARPELLDPTLNTDQIVPLFISTQVPVGIAGLVAAGVFAAAQSTISTSMNSTATTVVTDFMRPFGLCRTEAGYFQASRVLNFSLGGLGTWLGVLFVNPKIISLFDSFLTGIGLFMGVLAGLFLLGMLTRRANGAGALVGALLAFISLILLRSSNVIHWLLFAPLGILLCFASGYLVSLLIPVKQQSLNGLTVYTTEYQKK